ncbi:MAG: hypothetical protein QNL62_01235 [Gammaproteobacteria bacterium]|nr:hypothetical protein [Gammaproteobacteria bacterium]
MKTALKITAHAVLFSLLVSMASSSFAEDYYYGEDDKVKEGDIMVEVLARPLGLVGSAIGITLQAVGLLFSVPGENFGETAEVLVEEPLNYTFNRPLGRFEDNR